MFLPPEEEQVGLVKGVMPDSKEEWWVNGTYHRENNVVNRKEVVKKCIIKENVFSTR